MMSLSPGSVMLKVQTRKYFPQAVPSSWHGADDVAVPRVGYAQSADTEVFSTSCAELVVVAGVVMDTSLGQHSVVLDLRLSEGRGVVCNDDKLGLSVPEGLESLLVAQAVLTRLHHECQTSIDGLVG